MTNYRYTAQNEIAQTYYFDWNKRVVKIKVTTVLMIRSLE